MSEHQKTGKEPAPINTLTNQLQGSVAQETAKKAGERRAAEERNKLAQEQGTFILENGVLTAKVIGIEKKQTREVPPKDYLRVTFNSRFVENGANHASCLRH